MVSKDLDVSRIFKNKRKLKVLVETINDPLTKFKLNNLRQEIINIDKDENDSSNSEIDKKELISTSRALTETSFKKPKSNKK